MLPVGVSRLGPLFGGLRANIVASEPELHGKVIKLLGKHKPCKCLPLDQLLVIRRVRWGLAFIVLIGLLFAKGKDLLKALEGLLQRGRGESVLHTETLP